MGLTSSPNDLNIGKIILEVQWKFDPDRKVSFALGITNPTNFLKNSIVIDNIIQVSLLIKIRLSRG